MSLMAKVDFDFVWVRGKLQLHECYMIVPVYEILLRVNLFVLVKPGWKKFYPGSGMNR